MPPFVALGAMPFDEAQLPGVEVVAYSSAISLARSANERAVIRDVCVQQLASQCTDAGLSRKGATVKRRHNSSAAMNRLGTCMRKCDRGVPSPAH
jgi:hypothetical protein